MLAWRMILPQRSFSETVKAANSSGLMSLGVLPIASSRTNTSGWAATARMSALILSTISRGVPLGA